MSDTLSESKAVGRAGENQWKTTSCLHLIFMSCFALLVSNRYFSSEKTYEVFTDLMTDASSFAPEKRALGDVVYGTRRTGGSYGSLAKSQLQPTVYIGHQVETGDTLQRLALKYSVNIQEIKRTNKLWSDAELSLLKSVYIPVNPSQLVQLRTAYPTLNIIQSLPSATTRARQTSVDTVAPDQITMSMRSSDSTVSMPTTTNTSALQDYLSRIDQQISTSKKSLQTLDAKAPHLSSQIHNGDSKRENHTSPSQTSRTTLRNNARQAGVPRHSDNSVFVNMASQGQREKHVSAALQRIQREQDDFDEL